MQFKLIAIPATGDVEAEEELNCFLRSHRAVSVEKELVQGARHSSCGVTGNLTFFLFVGSLLPAPVAHLYRSGGVPNNHRFWNADQGG